MVELAASAVIYGLIAVAVVSALSLAGGIVLPFFKGSAQSRWMQFFVAMAVGTLSSDAILHLLPEIFGVHSHSHGVDEHHEHNHNHSEHLHEHLEHEHEYHEERTDEHALTLKLTLLLLVIYALYFFEFLLSNVTTHSHSYVVDAHDSAKRGSHAWDEENSGSDVVIEGSTPLTQTRAICCGLRGPAFIILVGDAVHNFFDGVAMGISFATGPMVGLTTTISVATHELPHELGDLAVLLQTGLSLPKALFLNFISALTAFMGLFVGLFAVSIDSAKAWLLAVTAGMFLYVAWVDMLAHLKFQATQGKEKWWHSALLQASGLLFGTVLMFLLAWYEDDILLLGH